MAFGGELELGPLTVNRSTVSRARRGRWCEVATGRTAIVLAARAARARRAGPALVPAYVCASVVQAIRAAGLQVRYYPVDESLGTPIDLLTQAVDRWSPSLTLVVNYFGFPAAPAIFDALSRTPRRGYIVEDCAHGSWLESADPPVGNRGDFVFTSFRKYLSVPDGVSPLAFPVRVARGARDRIRRDLASARVFCPVHWPLPPGVAGDYPASARLSAEMLSLPVDQRYDADAMDELVRRVAFACRKSG